MGCFNHIRMTAGNGENMEKSKNTNLHQAKSAKNDEFYTTKETVEAELKNYWPHFKNKIVYCNCDDPYESEFFKYFMIRFNLLKLKGLFATCYEGSQVSQHQLQLFDNEERKGIPYKIEIYQEDIDLLLTENKGELSQNTIKKYIKEHKKAEQLKGDGRFDSSECLEMLEKADLAITNPPFSMFRQYCEMLQKYHKKFIIWGNNNAITYKEIFPLIKENKMWLGYTANKTCVFKMPPSYEKWDEKLTAKYNDGFKYGKVPAISVFTNLDIPKRHDNLILYKTYSPEAYPHYDNYDAINVDRVSDIPCDYCESWGVTQEEYARIPEKSLWEITREETHENQKILFVIPAKGTKLRDELHEHTEKYREKIEEELGKAIYCSGCVGVPITVTDKLNPEQFEIINANEIKKNDSIPEKVHGLIKDKEGKISNNGFDKQIETGESRDRQTELSMLESYSARYCNGVMGVPITFLDKWCPRQFYIKGLDRYVEDNPKYGHRFRIRNKETYARILIQKIL